MKKVAVLSYSNSNNLGDPIQSLAAKALLGQAADLEMDRDHLDTYTGSARGIVLNGWFMDKPEHWPPAVQLDPLFISFHLNPTAEKKMTRPDGIAYFKKHEPIGCRDLYTQKTLEQKGIKTYYSACLTLSLQRNVIVPPQTPRKGILALSCLERMLPEVNFEQGISPKGLLSTAIQVLKFPSKYVKYKKAQQRLRAFLQHQNQPITYRSQRIPKILEDGAQFKALALDQLKAIATAEHVITSRIHTALPAVALGTPVILLSDGLEHPNQWSRMEGMEQFFPILSTHDLKTFSLKALRPGKAHLPYVDLQKEKITAFLKKLEERA